MCMGPPGPCTRLPSLALSTRCLSYIHICNIHISFTYLFSHTYLFHISLFTYVFVTYISLFTYIYSHTYLFGSLNSLSLLHTYLTTSHRPFLPLPLSSCNPPPSTWLIISPTPQTLLCALPPPAPVSPTPCRFHSFLAFP